MNQDKLGYVVGNKPSDFCALTWQTFISCPHRAQGRVAVLHVVTQQSRLFPSYNSSISSGGLRGHPSRGIEVLEIPLPLPTALKQRGPHIPSVYSSLTGTGHPSPDVMAGDAEES